MTVVVVTVGLISNPGISVVKPAKFTLEILSLFCSKVFKLSFLRYASKSKSVFIFVSPDEPLLSMLCKWSTEEPNCSKPKFLFVLVVFKFPKVTPVSDWKASSVEPKSNPSKLNFVVVSPVLWSPNKYPVSKVCPVAGVVVFLTVVVVTWVIFVFPLEWLAFVDSTPFTLFVALYSPNWAPSPPAALEACKISAEEPI